MIFLALRKISMAAAAAAMLILGSTLAGSALHDLVTPALGATNAGPSFSVRPGHFDPLDNATRTYFKATISAGRAFSSDVVVTDTGASPLTLLVYAVDGLTGQTSGVVYGDRRAPLRETAAWIHLSRHLLRLRPGEVTTVGFSVDVPRHTVAGDHLGGIAFEDAEETTSGGRFKITVVLREVVGVLIRVPGSASFTLRLGPPLLERMPGTGIATVLVPISDIGRLLGKPVLTVSLSGPSGYRRTVTRELDTVLPGDEIDYPFVWPDSLSAGTYRLTVLASGASAPTSVSNIQRLAASLRGADTPPALPAPLAASRQSSDGRSWLPFVVAPVVGLAGLLGGSRLRRRREASC